MALLPSAGRAITAKDLTSGFSDEMGKGYITGMVDMLSYQAVLQGNRERAICINNAFYRDDATLKRRLSKDHTAVNTGALADAISPQISVERSAGRAA